MRRDDDDDDGDEEEEFLNVEEQETGARIVTQEGSELGVGVETR